MVNVVLAGTLDLELNPVGIAARRDFKIVFKLAMVAVVH